jgi:hypothetical protein
LSTDQQISPAKEFRLPNIILILVLSILLCGEAYFGYRLHSLSSQQEQIKEDYSTFNNITFGLFSVDQWREKIAAVINHQVTDYSMSRQQQKALQARVEQQFHALIYKAVRQINKPQKTFAGRVKKFAFNKLVNADQIHAQVPSFAKTIITKINSPSSQKRLKNITTSKLNQLEAQTYDSTETATAALTSAMFRKYHVANTDEFNNTINSQLTSIRTVTYNYAWAMLGCVLVALCLWWFLRKQVHLHTTLFIVLLLFAFILLAVGITASVIEVDARIKTLNFMLLGEKVAFENQVLFFQSKSIFNIVEVLVNQPKPDAVLVGILIFVFVIVLPVLKLVATGIHVLSTKEIAENKVVKYFAYESGKWDMADVMVVGILMTYIGLNGILESQLSNLNIKNSFLTATTINYTSLQPGYFIFAGYVIYEIVLFAILKRLSERLTAGFQPIT